MAALQPQRSHPASVSRAPARRGANLTGLQLVAMDAVSLAQPVSLTLKLDGSTISKNQAIQDSCGGRVSS